MYIHEKYKNIAYQVPLSRIIFILGEDEESKLVFFTEGKELPDFFVYKDETIDKYTLGLYEGDTVESTFKAYKRYAKKLKSTSKRFIFFNYEVISEGAKEGHPVLILYDKITKELEFFQRNPVSERYSPYEEGTSYVISFF